VPNMDKNPAPSMKEHAKTKAKAATKSKKAVMPLKDSRLQSMTDDNFVGISPGFQFAFSKIRKVAKTDATVLFLGASGVGKEVFAKKLHKLSDRADKPFIAVNCAAIPEALIEPELFGVEKGAYTGAISSRKGRFERADGGVLFLDEIGDMPMEAQTRLLRVLQEGEYTSVGGRQAIKTDIRIIAASNKDLRQLIDQGLFREDLYFRLNVVPLHLPPLRNRVEDLPDLCRHFLKKIEKEEKLPPKSISADGLGFLKKYAWPGNVRELENLMRRISALYNDEVIGVDILRLELSDLLKAETTLPQAPLGSLAETIEIHLAQYFASQGNTLPPGLYQRILREVEEPLIRLSLSATNGNQIKAADMLGLNRNTLRKKIRDLKIDIVRNPKK